MLSENISNHEATMRGLFTNKMIIHLDVLATIMKNRISSNVGSRAIITKHLHWIIEDNPQFC